MQRIRLLLSSVYYRSSRIEYSLQAKESHASSRNRKQEISHNKTLSQLGGDCLKAQGNVKKTHKFCFVLFFCTGKTTVVVPAFPSQTVQHFLKMGGKKWQNRHNKHIVHHFLGLIDCNGDGGGCRDCNQHIKVREQSCCLWLNIKPDTYSI